MLAQSRQQLIQLYTSTLPVAAMRTAKAAIFQDIRDSYASLRHTHWGGRDYFGGWINRDINNADLALFYDYQQGVCAFSLLFAQAGENYEKFHALASILADAEPTKRQEWLEQDCPGIASRTDL